MTDSTVPQPCDRTVFQDGRPLLAADTSDCRAAGFEKWVQSIARESGQRVDWHYSGGVAQVLYVGDRDLVMKTAQRIPCPARIMKWFNDDDQGLFRAGVHTPPDGARIAFYEGGSTSTFI